MFRQKRIIDLEKCCCFFVKLLYLCKIHNKTGVTKYYMKKLLSFVILFLLLLPANAQLLWKISGNGLKKSSYLFGTHHLVPISFLDSIPKVYKCFNRSEVVVSEFVMSAANMEDKVKEAAMLPPNYVYTELLSDSDYHFVDSELKAVTKLSLNDVARLKPSMIANIYIVAYYQQLFPNDDDWQLDSFFQQVADRQGKKVVGLETIEDQIKLIYESQSIERQAFLLVGTLRGKDRITEELHELNAYYKKGNLVPLLQTYLNDSSEFAPTAQEKFLMLDARNLEWTKKLPDLLHKNSCFVAVGALHLVGENGLINLLRQKGYRVSKVK
ncbi:MAG: TraB family protein [Bacteroidetes bacterium ADurb.Bin057]|nr:MAG: TraB family protein [Bacteroidetes bacterium ADurb.Bin057]